jgi:hypothetical protein
MNGVFDGNWRGSTASRCAYDPRAPKRPRDTTVQPFQPCSL